MQLSCRDRLQSDAYPLLGRAGTVIQRPQRIQHAVAAEVPGIACAVLRLDHLDLKLTVSSLQLRGQPVQRIAVFVVFLGQRIGGTHGCSLSLELIGIGIVAAAPAGHRNDPVGIGQKRARR